MDIASLLVGWVLGFIIFFIIVFFALYIYMALALMAIAKRTKTKEPWFAWIPILNILLMLRIAKMHWAFIFVFLFSFIPIIGWIAGIVLTVIVWGKVSEARKRPFWWGFLTLIPIVNLVIIGILAWSKK